MCYRACTRVLIVAALVAAAILALPVAAFDGLVKKEVFTMPTYTTVNGKTIKNVRVGYESYGTLNAAKDNVVLVCHFFTGTSHAAGKYKAEDAAPGYWDAIIGAGKAIDTDKYFVISIDTLLNVNTKDPNVTTTGPSTINPDTGKPYGTTFPVVSFRDFVNVQKALLDSLGIKELVAVAGAVGRRHPGGRNGRPAYPDMVERVVAVIAPGLEIDGFGVGMLNLWGMPITMDPKWNNGDDYAGRNRWRVSRRRSKAADAHARRPTLGWTSGSAGTGLRPIRIPVRRSAICLRSRMASTRQGLLVPKPSTPTISSTW